MEKSNAAPTVMLLTAMDGAETLAEILSEQARVIVELVRNRRAALASLRRYSFDAVVVDTRLPPGEVTPTQMIWQNAGDALPVEVDLQGLGAGGMARLLRGILHRREQMEIQAREKVVRSLAEEMLGPITGLLLQSELVLQERELTVSVKAKVREMRALAEDLRIRLGPAH